MALTREFRETFQARAVRDPAFRRALLAEGVECLLAGDLQAGRLLLRDYVNATIGFEKLGEMAGKSPKSLMRMLGPRGNPRARNLLELLSVLQDHEGVHFDVRVVG